MQNHTERDAKYVKTFKYIIGQIDYQFEENATLAQYKYTNIIVHV